LIREYTGFAAWSKEARHVAAAAGYEAALIMGRAADITNAVIGALTNARFELPPFSILERTTRHARALAHRKLCGNVFASACWLQSLLLAFSPAIARYYWAFSESWLMVLPSRAPGQAAHRSCGGVAKRALSPKLFPKPARMAVAIPYLVTNRENDSDENTPDVLIFQY
jgi:hypothetical protein